MTENSGCAAEVIVAAMLAGVLAFAIYVAGSPEMTARWNTREVERTARIVAAEQGKTAREQAWQQTLQTNGPWVAGAVVLVVVAVQAGRTWRHREDRQAETRRLLVAYVAQNYLPGERVRIEQRGGRLALVDYERKQVIPADVVETQWRQLPGPTDVQ
jgi:uncharacterized protein involved in response to NO